MYEDFVLQMQNAATASERTAVVEEMCCLFAFSKQKAYAALKAGGWHSGRKVRADAGSSAADEETIRLIAAILQNSVRKNGKKTMSIENARAVLLQNGYDVPISSR